MAWFGMQNPGSRIAVIAPTFADARDTCVEGVSGLLSVIPEVCIDTWNRNPNGAELVLWNGTRYKLFSASEAGRLRGPQHHRAWAEELCEWPDPDTWDQLQFGLRLGDCPQVVVTTTPKPTPLLKDIMATSGVMITRGSTFDNADNLAAHALQKFRAKYEGTRLGRQELFAEVLDDVQGALWTVDMLDTHRLRGAPSDLQRIVVAVDPSGTSGNGKGDNIGIVAAAQARDGRFYVLEDDSCNLSPEGWARRVVALYEKWGADRVVAERNFGGAMVEAVLRTASRNLPVRMVTASRGKIVRAEPIAALYEQGKVSHCGAFNDLEDEMCAMTGAGYVGKGSPDRADALVWALTDLSSNGYRYNIEALT